MERKSIELEQEQFNEMRHAKQAETRRMISEWSHTILNSSVWLFVKKSKREKLIYQMLHDVIIPLTDTLGDYAKRHFYRSYDLWLGANRALELLKTKEIEIEELKAETEKDRKLFIMTTSNENELLAKKQDLLDNKIESIKDIELRNKKLEISNEKLMADNEQYISMNTQMAEAINGYKTQIAGLEKTIGDIALEATKKEWPKMPDITLTQNK